MWIILATLLTLAGPTINVEQHSEVPAGATGIAPSLGVSLQIPQGTTGMVSGEGLLVVGAGRPVASVTVEDVSLEDAVAILRQGYERDGTFYQVVGQVAVRGDSVSASLQGASLFGPATPARVLVRKIPQGQAVLLFVSGGPDARAAVDALYSELVAGLRVSAPKTPAAAPVATGGPSEWRSWLTNKRLAQFSRGSGASDMYSAYLCDGGRLSSYYSGSADYQHAGGGATNLGTVRGSAEGRWSVAGDQLTLQWNDGRVQRFTISRNSQGHFLLNGERWYRTDTDCG